MALNINFLDVVLNIIFICCALHIFLLDIYFIFTFRLVLDKAKVAKATSNASIERRTTARVRVMRKDSRRQRSSKTRGQSQNKKINNNSDVDMVSDDDDGIARNVKKRLVKKRKDEEVGHESRAKQSQNQK